MKSDIVEAFSQMAKEKNIDRDILSSVIKDSFNKMMEKKYGPEANFDVVVNMDKGVIEIFLYKVVVEEVMDEGIEIDVETAKEKAGEDFQIGDDFAEEIPIEQFGRRMVINLKQNLNQKIREIEKEITYNAYKDQVGEIVVGEIYQIKPTSILLIHNGNEIIFPKGEQIPKEKYKKGDTTRAIIKSIEKRQSGPPLIIVSRADEQFLDKLFELEIPEIYDGIIEIKGIAREPGERAKISVISNDDRVDAVGACVGMKGIRIHSIVRELSNENIDVINYTEDPALYIARALSPAKLNDIYLDNENKIAKIYADEDQISLIIGKSGQNIKLASRLSGYQIDVVREAEEEVEDEEDIDENELDENVNDEVDDEDTDESGEDAEDEADEDAEDEADEKADEEETEEEDSDEDTDDAEEDADENDEQENEIEETEEGLEDAEDSEEATDEELEDADKLDEDELDAEEDAAEEEETKEKE
ncbi:MAG TPA: transcription termination factor NusA [Ignavibacteria bacterium]|nr:transcription termination factor NusA [Ignavibacteria bacterium]HQY51284.1 transcription termination factor NusA [Ignavibacteria bacterium]HRB00018.1 transcription termination factor NusA [Ignavibacteria bacterium]